MLDLFPCHFSPSLKYFPKSSECVRRRGNKHRGFPSSIHPEGYSGDFRLYGGRSGDASSCRQTLSRIWRKSSHVS